MELVAYLLTGAAAGLLAGLLGIGGGLVIVPALAWLFALQGFAPDTLMHFAVGTSLAVIVPTAMSSLWAHQRRGSVDWTAVCRLVPGLVLGGLAGAALARVTSSSGLAVVFGLFEIAVGLQLAFGYEPARHLGGDFFDFLPYGGDRVAVAIGDVSGKSTSAALYGALAVGILREYAVNRKRGPSRSLADLNRKLGRLQFDNRFLAMAFAVYEGSERRLRLANAGLPYPYVLRGRRLERLELGGVPLGLLPDREYEEIDLDLEPGNSLVMVSDGVEDSRNEAGEEFGRQRLEDTLRRLAPGSAREIAQGLVQATRLFAGNAEAYDDRTVVVIKAAEG